MWKSPVSSGKLAGKIVSVLVKKYCNFLVAVALNINIPFFLEENSAFIPELVSRRCAVAAHCSSGTG